MTEIRSRRAGIDPVAAKARPLYARALGLQFVQPSNIMCFLFFEGTIALGVLLALAELANWWTPVILPLSVAIMVKVNDVIAGATARSGAGSRGSAVHVAGAGALADRKGRPERAGRPSGLGTSSGFAPSSQLGTSGLGTSGLGTSGLGTSGLAPSGLAPSGFGTSGFGASGLGASGQLGTAGEAVASGGAGTSSSGAGIYGSPAGRISGRASVPDDSRVSGDTPVSGGGARSPDGDVSQPAVEAADLYAAQRRQAANHRYE